MSAKNLPDYSQLIYTVYYPEYVKVSTPISSRLAVQL